MDHTQRVEYALRIATAREDLRDYQYHLDAMRQEIANAQRAIEDLTIDACTQRVRMKELELDEELVKQSEDEAIKDKIQAQTRLADLGGHESAVRILQRALDHARQDLVATKEETEYVMAEERKMQLELVKLGAMLTKSHATSVKLQEEYSLVMRDKRESDVKLKQLCLFLQTEAPTSPTSATTDAAFSPPPSPAKSTVTLGDGVEVTVPEVHF